jgi:hypothetical protein
MIIYTQEFAEQATKLMDGVREEFFMRLIASAEEQLGRTSDDTWNKDGGNVLRDFEGL